MFDAPKDIWQKVNISFIVFFVLLGFINLYVASQYDTETWAFFKVFGIMAINFIYIFGLVLYMSRYMIDTEQSKE